MMHARGVEELADPANHARGWRRNLNASCTSRTVVLHLRREFFQVAGAWNYAPYVTNGRQSENISGDGLLR